MSSQVYKLVPDMEVAVVTQATVGDCICRFKALIGPIGIKRISLFNRNRRSIRMKFHDISVSSGLGTRQEGHIQQLHCTE
jgi:hypothetical protein